MILYRPIFDAKLTNELNSQTFINSHKNPQVSLFLKTYVEIPTKVKKIKMHSKVFNTE